MSFLDSDTANKSRRQSARRNLRDIKAESEGGEKSAVQIEAAIREKLDESQRFIEKNDKERERINRMILAATKRAPPNLVPLIEKSSFVLSWILQIIYVIIPIYVKMYSKIYGFYNKLPTNVMDIVFGLVLCFYGGSFPMVIAAYEAFRLSGTISVMGHLSKILHDIDRVNTALKDDDRVDEDKDGVADIEKLSDEEYLQRKVSLVLSTCEPDQITYALGGLYTSWLAVAATLKLEFAKTIALGAAIGDQLRQPVSKILAPALAHALPAKYHNWINTIVNTLCKSIAISVAYACQRVISAVHSAIKGGGIAAKGIIAFLQTKGLLKGLDADESYVDEILAIGIAIVGVYSQIMYGFSLNFPISVLAMPLTLLESTIYWSVSS